MSKLLDYLYYFRYHKPFFSKLLTAIAEFGNVSKARILSTLGLHHIGLNVIDINASIAFYTTYFGAQKVMYNEQYAIKAEQTFLLLQPVDKTPATHLGSSLWHIGWSGIDGQSEFDWRVQKGIKVHTPLTPLDGDHWMYFWGPNQEIVEVYTGKKTNNFEHIHLLASDVDVTMKWFRSYLGLNAAFRRGLYSPRGFKWNYITVDNIDIVVFGKPDTEESWWPKGEFKPTDGSSFDHIGFSCSSIEPVFKKVKSKGVEIVRDIQNHAVQGHRSFFVRGPDQLLIEIVEDKNLCATNHQ